jgi:hypothetical protein
MKIWNLPKTKKEMSGETETKKKKLGQGLEIKAPSWDILGHKRQKGARKTGETVAVSPFSDLRRESQSGWGRAIFAWSKKIDPKEGKGNNHETTTFVAACPGFGVLISLCWGWVWLCFILSGRGRYQDFHYVYSQDNEQIVHIHHILNNLVLYNCYLLNKLLLQVLQL